MAEAIRETDAERAAVIFYGATLLVISLLLSALWGTITRDRDLLRPGVSEREMPSPRNRPWHDRRSLSAAGSGNIPELGPTERHTAQGQPTNVGARGAAKSMPVRALDDVVNLEDLGIRGELNSNLGQDRHQPLAEGPELLLGVPDLTRRLPSV
jgi:hypothetical protein